MYLSFAVEKNGLSVLFFFHEDFSLDKRSTVTSDYDCILAMLLGWAVD